MFGAGRKLPALFISSRMTHTVRRARLDEARGIAEVQVASWRATYCDILPASVLDELTVEARERMWTSVLSGSGTNVFVALDGDRVTGFVAAGAARDSDVDRSAVGEIMAIYAVEDAWSTGVGRVLFTSACRSLESLGFTEVVVWVLEANQRGRRFYERMLMHLDEGAETYFEAEGIKYREVRYRRTLTV